MKQTMTTKIIKIKCKGSRLVDLSTLKIIQGELKDLSPMNHIKLRKRITEKGFDAPFFVWRDKILDGTQRKKVLDLLIEEGWTIEGGKVPVCDIKAQNLNEAKDRLLGFVSMYGKVTQDGVSEFLASIEEPDLETIELPGVSELLNTIETKELDFQQKELKPYKKTHVLLSFSPSLFARLERHLEAIIEVEGVEYEQGSN